MQKMKNAKNVQLYSFLTTENIQLLLGNFKGFVFTPQLFDRQFYFFPLHSFSIQFKYVSLISKQHQSVFICGYNCRSLPTIGYWQFGTCFIQEQCMIDLTINIFAQIRVLPVIHFVIVVVFKISIESSPPPATMIKTFSNSSFTVPQEGSVLPQFKQGPSVILNSFVSSMIQVLLVIPNPVSPLISKKPFGLYCTMQ